MFTFARDESKTHKQAVMSEQRRAAAGKVNELQQEALREQFKDVQTLLKPIKVVNPFAEALALPSRYLSHCGRMRITCNLLR